MTILDDKRKPSITGLDPDTFDETILTFNMTAYASAFRQYVDTDIHIRISPIVEHTGPPTVMLSIGVSINTEDRKRVGFTDACPHVSRSVSGPLSHL